MPTKKFSLDEEIIKKRIVIFHNEVRDWSVEAALKALIFLDAKNSSPIRMYICSPGGGVDHGLALYDFMQSARSPIYTHCSGYAASMGAVLLAGGKKGHRTATKNSRIMIHQPSAGYAGKATDIEIHSKETARIRKLLAQLVANDTGQVLKKVLKDMDQDLWLTAEQAKAYGLIDKIV